MLANGRGVVGSVKDTLVSSTIDEATDFLGDGKGTKLPTFSPKKGGGGGGGGGEKGREVSGGLINVVKVEG